MMLILELERFFVSHSPNRVNEENVYIYKSYLFIREWVVSVVIL